MKYFLSTLAAVLFLVAVSFGQENVKSSSSSANSISQISSGFEGVNSAKVTRQVSFTCTGTGAGRVTRGNYSTNLCGTVDQLQEGFYATYNFIPYDGSTLDHMYVNNVDKINELGQSYTSSGLSYSWQLNNITQDYSVVAVFNQIPTYTVNYSCTGTGSGKISKNYYSGTNICGSSEQIQEGDYVYYYFTPNNGSALSHLYVNNVDRLNELSVNYYSSGVSYSWQISSINQNYTIQAVFNQAQTFSVNFDCTGTGSGRATKNSYYGTNLCGSSDQLQEGFYATYNFIPDNGSTLDHLYVNNVDKINELSQNYTSSGISYSWQIRDIRQNHTIRPEFNQIPTYNVSFTCIGTGSGRVTVNSYYGNNLCGSSDQLQEGFYATYNFIPDNGSTLTHVYVNNVDRINELSVDYYSSGVSYSWQLYNADQNYWIQCVFSVACDGNEVVVLSSNPDWGSVEGGGCLPTGATEQIRATPTNSDYVFLRWNDGNTNNPRTIHVTEDITYIAIFALANNIEEQVVSTIYLFPNPVSNTLNIVSHEIISHIEIFSSSGQLVLRRDVNSEIASCNIEALPRGMYIARIYSGDKILAREKIIKE